MCSSKFYVQNTKLASKWPFGSVMSFTVMSLLNTLPIHILNLKNKFMLEL